MGQIISEQIPYSGPTLQQQSTPIGAIIPYMGKTAPSGYLACDGGVYNISQYPLLAGFFETQFGSINYFGGNGSTTFAVPNLNGEFLRGTGTNAHENQGSGGEVGEHRDGTVMPYLRSYTSGNAAGQMEMGSNFAKSDSIVSNSENIAYFKGSYTTAGGYTTTTTRPTNTSVLYLIKAKSDRLDKITFAEVDDESISDRNVWSASKINSLISKKLVRYNLTEEINKLDYIIFTKYGNIVQLVIDKDTSDTDVSHGELLGTIPDILCPILQYRIPIPTTIGAFFEILQDGSFYILGTEKLDGLRLSGTYCTLN